MDQRKSDRSALQRASQARDERRSRRFHAFLLTWARRHMPERVRRFPARP